MVRDNSGLWRLDESKRDFIASWVERISTFYPDAYQALNRVYGKSRMNRWYLEFQIVRRFLACNFAVFDDQPDVDGGGRCNFEFINCPLRGECEGYRVICHPRFESKLSIRELEIFRQIFEGKEATQIADEMHLSVHTVNNHRRNIQQRIGVRNIAEMIDYAHTHKLFTNP